MLVSAIGWSRLPLRARILEALVQVSTPRCIDEDLGLPVEVSRFGGSDGVDLACFVDVVVVVGVVEKRCLFSGFGESG